MSLSERAILTQLSISIWSGTVARTPTEENTGLDLERDTIVHAVIPRRLLHEIQGQGRIMRQTHYRFTAPWDDNGLRLLPSATLLKYSEVMRDWRQRFDEKVQELLPKIQRHIDPEHATKFKDIKDKFGTRLSFYNIPDGEHLPLLADTITADLRNSIVQSMKSDTQVRTAETLKTLRQTLYKACKRLAAYKLAPELQNELHENTLLVAKTIESLDGANIPLESFWLEQFDYENLIHCLETQYGCKD